MSTKICTKCNTEKEGTEFNQRSWCKCCVRDYNRQYAKQKFQNDPEFREKRRQYSAKNTQRMGIRYAIQNQQILQDAFSNCSLELQSH